MTDNIYVPCHQDIALDGTTPDPSEDAVRIGAWRGVRRWGKNWKICCPFASVPWLPWLPWHLEGALPKQKWIYIYI